MLLSVNNVDLTKHINLKTYSVNAVKVYGGTWQDGNFREHRVYVRDKVEGSFDVTLYGKDGMTTQAFIDNWNAATENEVVTMLVYVQNKARLEPIQAYFEFTGKFHRELINGAYCDKVTINIEER